MTCRAFRALGIENLIQVKFCDDNYMRFPYDCVEKVILPICRDGINIAGRQYYEIGGSQSAFRDHSTFFYATERKADITRLWLRFGEFGRATAAKCFARIGLMFTTARVSIFETFNKVCVKIINKKLFRTLEFKFATNTSIVFQIFFPQLEMRIANIIASAMEWEKLVS